MTAFELLADCSVCDGQGWLEDEDQLIPPGHCSMCGGSGKRPRVIVINRHARTNGDVEPDRRVVYIGRGSAFGNHFVIGAMHEGKKIDRGAAVRLHKALFLYEIETAGAILPPMISLLAQLKLGTTLALECFCAPAACHGATVKEILDKWIEMWIKQGCR